MSYSLKLLFPSSQPFFLIFAFPSSISLQSSAQLPESKNPFFHNFFYPLQPNNLKLILSEVEGQISLHLRRFALIGKPLCMKDKLLMEITIEYQPISQASAASGGKSIKNNKLCKTNPIYAFFRPKTAIMRKNKPKQTQYKPNSNPFLTSQPPIKPKTNPIYAQTNPIFPTRFLPEKLPKVADSQLTIGAILVIIRPHFGSSHF